ncbi:IS1595 family transposase [Candidatus Woesearchaeota archaeon]|nr:IS1595 family transposase [Candidatus Woesearchaeota archaeon]
MKKELSDMYFLGRKCIICNRYGLYKLKNRRRVKCKHCKKYYSLKRLRRDLDILYYFYLEVSARKTAKEMELDYGVVHRRFMEFRKLIANYCNEQAIRLNGKIELDETYFGGKRKGKRGRGSKNKAIAFGILERKGKVYTVIIENVSAETLMREIQNKTRKGSVFYTDGFKSYASLRQYGKHDTIDYDYSYVKGKTHINGIEGFWSYSKERFHKYHGINKKNYPLYLKEMEFRFNNRKENVLKLLVDICIRRRRISAKLH